MKTLRDQTPDQSPDSSEKIVCSLMEHSVIGLFLAQEPDLSQHHMTVV